jgi:hypothetical protein
VGDDERTLNRQGNVDVRGAQYQWSFAYGGNIKDKFSLVLHLELQPYGINFHHLITSNLLYSSDYESPLDGFKNLMKH